MGVLLSKEFMINCLSEMGSMLFFIGCRILDWCFDFMDDEYWLEWFGVFCIELIVWFNEL